MNQSERQFTHSILKVFFVFFLILSTFLLYKFYNNRYKEVIDQRASNEEYIDQKSLVPLSIIQSKLPALKTKFEQNSAVYLLVEFATLKNQTNWLWLEVLEWNEKSLIGLLIDQPTKTFHLRQGIQVKFKESSVKDYQLYTNNIFVSGNLTSKKSKQKETATIQL